MKRALLLAAAALLVALFDTTRARAEEDAGASGSITGCVEQIPTGATRPLLSDVFPHRATSGWAATLSVVLEHGKGERVLPAGLEHAATTEAQKRLKEAGFTLPSQGGTAAGQVWTEPVAAGASLAKSHVELPLVPLPEGPGRHVLTVPPLPIAVARANGEIMTLCTHAHTIVVEDPIASVPDAQPRPNPPPRPQREEWTALKTALAWTAAGVVLGAALLFLLRWWRGRPVPVPPPPPPRPPWEVALEKLAEIRGAHLLEEDRHAEYIDRVSDVVRSYLGARFGFDGLESTTDEILAALRASSAGFVRLDEAAGGAAAFGADLSLREIQAFLGECDLVKFANLVPSTDQCTSAFAVGERIVRTTMPRVTPPSAPAKEAAP